jgi:hypothetical protein
VLLDDLRGGGGRPWDTGEFIRAADPNPDRYDPDVVFRQQWNASVPISLLPAEERAELTASLPLLDGQEEQAWEEDEEESSMFLETVAPWGLRFPGLALPERGSGDATRYDEAVLGTPPARVGLVAADRPADIPAVVGWAGVVNHFSGDEGAVILSAMMRSWEDRFGARLFRLGFDTMEFLVERPPATEASAEAVAAEHFSFAGQDGLDAQELPTPSLASLADSIIGNPTWRFWWD